MAENRIKMAVLKIQTAIDLGQKVDGTGPVGDLAALEAGLELETFERTTYLNAQAVAHSSGLLTTDEALVVYGALMNWDSASLATKIVVTKLMGELIIR